MSRKIIGVTVGTTLPKPNFDQTDPRKGDYIRGDRTFITPDDTLTHVGRPADAKATGDAINKVQTSIDEVSQIVENLNDVYYTESEIDSMVDDVNAAIDAKSDDNHNHDTLYYTETEIDDKFDVMQSDINSKVDKDTYDEEISDLNNRIDDVEGDIHTINEALSGVSEEFEEYKQTNSEAVSAHDTEIEAIKADYLTSDDKAELKGNITQLQDNITEVSNKVAANESAIEILNGEGDGSVKKTIDNAFNEFAANISNDGVVNTYKELIDYAATHGSEFTELVGEVDSIDTRVGEVESDLTDYKTSVSDQLNELQIDFDSHNDDKENPHEVTAEQVGAYTKEEIEELITAEDIDDICGSNVIIGGGDADVVSYATKQWVQDGYQPKGNYLTSVPDGYATESYVNTQIASIPTPNVSGQINAHNIATDSHNDIRLIINGLSTRLNTLADCDDDTLDQMSEVVDYIKSNKSLIEGITTKKVNVSDIIDNLTTNVSNKPLSAAQGVILNGLIEELASNLSNYQPKGDYLTAVPDGYATEEFVTTKIAEAELSAGITKEELKDVIDEYFEENPVSSSNNSLFASDDDNGNVTLTVVGFSVSDDDSGNITIS